MASVYLSAQSNAPGSSEIVLINGEPSTTGYRLLNVDVGNPAFDKQYSGPRGTLGAVLAGETAQNRLSTFRLQAVGSSQDDLEAKLSVLWLLDEQIRRYGGTVTWRPQGSSYRMKITALDSGVALEALDVNLFVLNNRANVNFGVVSGPYYEGEPLDISDDFSSNTIGNYTFDTGSASNLSITGGVLTVTGSPTTEKRLIHTDRGYLYGDHQATLKATPGSTISSFKAGVVLKRIDASNYLEVYIDDNATNSRLRIDKVVATVRTNLATTNLGARVANGTAFWVRGRIEGVNVYAEHFVSAPSPMATPTTSTSYTLSTAEQATFGTSVYGAAGIDWIPQQSAATLDDFDLRAFVYRNLTLPERLSLYGPTYGDASSLASLEITPSGGSAAPIWALLGWWTRTATYNYAWNGDFENVLLGAAPWSVAAVTNINGAATSITRITTAAKYGVCSGQIVCPATSGTGANFRIFHRFKKGVTYTAEAWIHAASATTNTAIRLGNGAANDTATSGNTALSTSWQRITVAWTPTADRDDAHVAVIISAATATTFEVDGVMVYEGTTAPTSPNQTEGRGGFPPFGVVEAENFAIGPANLSNEQQQIALTTDISGSFTLTYSGQTTASLSWDGSAGNAITVAELTTALENLSNIAPGDVSVSNELSGGGVAGKRETVVTFQGTLAGTNVSQMTSGGSNPATVTTLVEGGLSPVQADAAYRLGYYMLPGLSGSYYTAKTVIDPALLVPDDYTQNEVAIEVWGRQTVPQTAMTVRISAWPVTASASVASVTSEEFGSAGKLLVPPSSGTPLRFTRLGTLRMRTDLGRYLLVWESTTGGAKLDYFVLVPANSRALSPTARVGDSSFPSFVSTTNEITKKVRADLSSTIKEPASGTPEVNAAGLGGALIEFPPGDEMLVKLSSLVPDDPSSTSTAEQLAHSATVHLDVLPRWRLGRSS